MSTDTLERRTLGRSGLSVSAIGLGCVTFGREIDAATACAVLDRARESGVNLLDTAAAYHGGESERVLGAWLAERGCRGEFTIATKVAPPLGRERIIASAGESLSRLRVDSIDLFQLHSWDPATPVEESLDALETLREQGKIRHFGCSNWSLDQLRTHPAMETIQPPYNLVQRDIEAGLIEHCATAGVGILTYSPLAAGFLTGKYTPGGPIPGGTRFDLIPAHQPIYFTERGWAVLDRLRAVAAREGKSLMALALEWVLSRSGISTVLIGARGPEQIDQALQAVETARTARGWDWLEDFEK